jgi:uncharacterized protein
VIGTFLGDRLPERVRHTVMAGIGLTTLLIGMQMALKTQHLLIVLASIAVGAIVGELIGIEAGLERLGGWLEARLGRISKAGAGKSSATNFTRAYVTASLIFCVGPMTIVGSIQDGLTGDYQTLAVKSMLDWFTGLAFASTLGIGVAFSGVTVLLYQGLLTLGAGWLKAVLTEAMITEMTATGGLLILGIGLRLLEIKQIRVANLLPALVLAPVGVAVLGSWL